jgi:pimeloyl-ACP methyl ester carboxylesterase
MTLSLTHLAGIRSRLVSTPRGQFHLLEAGDPADIPVLFIHGNLSSSTFWEETMLALPTGFAAFAPDLRGYGQSDPLPVDATRGMRDFSDDLHTLTGVLGLERLHIVGHSLGGCIAMQFTIDHPQRVRSLTLVATGSPYGYGGSRDAHGTPCTPDYAGSGGGLINPEFLRRLAAGDASDESPFSPRMVLRHGIVMTAQTPQREDMLVAAMLQTNTSEDNYSRDHTLSPHWPHFGPGTRGVNNALSPKYCNLSALAQIQPQPPILWVRGGRDLVVSDSVPTDPANLGAAGIIPNYPGVEVYPPQPMNTQIRTVLEQYATHGGSYREELLAHVGHTPYLDDPAGFQAVFGPFLMGV